MDLFLSEVMRPYRLKLRKQNFYGFVNNFTVKYWTVMQLKVYILFSVIVLSCLSTHGELELMEGALGVYDCVCVWGGGGVWVCA